jgi:small subunit ribosomal protein S3
VPLHTFRADIDYGLAEARTTYGVIGIKVWIFKGEVFDQAQIDRAAEAAQGEAANAAAAAAAAAPVPAPPVPAVAPQPEAAP